MSKLFWSGVAVFIGGLITWLINHLINGMYFDYGGKIYFSCMVAGLLIIILDYFISR